MKTSLTYDVIQPNIPIPIVPFGRTVKGSEKKMVMDNIVIQNAREFKVPLSLMEEGIQVVHAPTKLKNKDFYNEKDDSLITSVYIDELCSIVKNVVGASMVTILPEDHFGNGSVYTVRNLKAAYTKIKRNGGGMKDALFNGNLSVPLRGAIHTDYAEESAIDIMKTIYESYPQFKNGRYVLLNAWRNIADIPVVDDNLCMLKPSSMVKEEDCITVALTSDNTSVNHIAKSVLQYHLSHTNVHKHEWVYYPNLVKNELLLFRQWDSDNLKEPVVFHSAFHDANAPKNAPYRESIEVRLVCLWEADVNGENHDSKDFSKL